MDLKKIVNEKMDSVVSSGKIEELIENKVSSAVDKAIEEYFSNWGDFQKELNETLKEKMKVDLKEMNIPEYNKLILTYIEKEMDRSMNEHGLEMIKNNIKELLNSAPAEIALQDIVSKYIDDSNMDIHESCIEYIYYNYEFSDVVDGYVDITIHTENPGRYDSPDLYFGLKEIEDGKYKIWRVSVGKKLISDDFTVVGKLYGMEKRLFQYYTAGTIVLVDDFDDISTATKFAV